MIDTGSPLWTYLDAPHGATVGYADATNARWRQLAREYGWRPASRRSYLPARVARTDWMSQQRWNWDACDHPRRWLDRYGDPLVTFEPYTDHVWDKAAYFAPFADECARHDLTVEMGDVSPYYPGRTTLLVVSRASDRPRIPKPCPNTFESRPGNLCDCPAASREECARRYATAL